MGLAFIFNPDWVATADLPLVFQDVDAGAIVTASGYGGRPGLTATGGPALVTTALRLREEKRFAMGCRIKISSDPSSTRLVLAVVDPALEIHCAVGIDTDGRLGIYRGNLVAPIDAGGGETLNHGTWYRLGFRGELHPTLGTAEVTLDGVRVLQTGNESTVNTDVWIQGGIAIGLAPEVVSAHYYMSDAAVGGYAGLLPDLLVAIQRPTGDGTFTSDFAPVGAASLAAAVDDTTQDGDTTHAVASEVETPVRLSLAMGPALDASIGTVYAIQVSAIAKTIDATTNDRSATAITVVDGRDDGGPWHALDDTYRVVRALWDQNPATGRAWQPAEVDAADAGVRVPQNPNVA